MLIESIKDVGWARYGSSANEVAGTTNYWLYNGLTRQLRVFETADAAKAAFDQLRKSA